MVRSRFEGMARKILGIGWHFGKAVAWLKRFEAEGVWMVESWSLGPVLSGEGMKLFGCWRLRAAQHPHS